jgi:hypothetical protein
MYWSKIKHPLLEQDCPSIRIPFYFDPRPVHVTTALPSYSAPAQVQRGETEANARRPLCHHLKREAVLLMAAVDEHGASADDADAGAVDVESDVDMDAPAAFRCVLVKYDRQVIRVGHIRGTCNGPAVYNPVTVTHAGSRVVVGSTVSIVCASSVLPLCTVQSTGHPEQQQFVMVDTVSEGPCACTGLRAGSSSPFSSTLLGSSVSMIGKTS